MNNTIAPGWRGTVGGAATVLGALFLVGCQEQFRLRVVAPDAVTVVEHQDGAGTFEYHGDPDHQTGWVFGSAHTEVTTADVHLDFRYGTPSRYHSLTRVALSTPLSNLCDVRVRHVPNRGIGAMLLFLGAGAAVVAVDATTEQRGTFNAWAPALATGAGTLALAGATLLLWPSGAGTVVASNPQPPAACTTTGQ